MAGWIGCPATERRLLAVGMICHLYKMGIAGNPIAIQGTEHQFLELVTVDADMQCFNGGEIANEGRKMVPTFGHDDGKKHAILREAETPHPPVSDLLEGNDCEILQRAQKVWRAVG